jgi:hypothetical protein
MSKALVVTGVLTEAVIIPTMPDPKTGNPRFKLSGTIKGDINKRFEDGTRIFTSYIKKRHKDNVFATLNSVYKVEDWLVNNADQYFADPKE